MRFTEEQIQHFRDLYFKRYGKEVSVEEATDQARKLLAFVMLIYKPMPKEAFDEIQKRRIETLPEMLAWMDEQEN